MKEIILANNKGVALVDDEDYKWLIKRNWHLDGDGYANSYFKIGIKDKMHRLVMSKYHNIKNLQIDHIDNNKLNNQKSNLRLCLDYQNRLNRPKRKDSKQKYKGIRRVGNNYCARIKKNHKYIHIGTFETEKEAALAYNKKAIELFGEFAYLNKIDE